MRATTKAPYIQMVANWLRIRRERLVVTSSSS
jgi:hypothetical protein